MDWCFVGDVVESTVLLMADKGYVGVKGQHALVVGDFGGRDIRRRVFGGIRLAGGFLKSVNGSHFDVVVDGVPFTLHVLDSSNDNFRDRLMSLEPSYAVVFGVSEDVVNLVGRRMHRNMVSDLGMEVLP